MTRNWPEKSLTPLEYASKVRPEGYQCRPPVYEGSDITQKAEEAAVTKFLERFDKLQRAEQLKEAAKIVRQRRLPTCKCGKDKAKYHEKTLCLACFKKLNFGQNYNKLFFNYGQPKPHKKTT